MSETYQQGTVSVVKNSHTVIGQDTYFEQIGNIEAGSLLTLDNQTHYLITEVISDNELVIETLVTRLPYQGETVTDAPYVVTKSFSRQTNTGLIAELTEFQASFIDKQLAFYEWAFNASDTYSFTAGEAVREILTPEGIANKLAQKSSEEGIYTSVTSDNTLVWVRNKNGTTWTPSNTATAITISFLKAGEVIGAKVVTATLNTTAGTINISETANTGQATTLTTTNNNTAAPTISVMHDASKATVTQALSALASGEAGPKGEVGKAGPQGVRGIQGPAGQVRYTWLRYADTAAGEGISNSPVGKTYVGFAHNKTTPIESNTPTDYVWTKIKGEDGVNGTDGIPGKDGENTYTWIKYSQYFDGTGLTNVPDDNTRYIGIAYNKTTPQESTVKTDYVWSKFKGEDGSQGPQGEQGIQGPAGNDGVSNYFHIAYADSSDGSTNFNQSAGDYVGTYVDNNPTDSANPNDYNWVRWKGAQGNDGSDGIAGTNGVDGKTSYLHIAYANSADGTVGFNQSAGDYIGQYVDFTLADSTNPASYQWTKIKGEAGKDGVDGTDGQNGTDGRRGSEHYYISTTGSAWSNSLANSATEGNNVVGDRVTITNFTNGWTQTRFWNSSGQWDDTQLTVIDGALVVNVEAIIPKIFANTIEASDTIRAVNGETTVQMSAVEDAALFVARGNRVLFSVGDESGDILDGLALRPSSVQGDALSEDALAAIQKFLGTSVADTGGRVSKEFTFDTLNQSQRLLVTLKHGSSPISMQVSVATRWFYDDAIPDSRDAEFRIEYRAQGTSAWTILHYGTLTARIASQYPDGSATLVATYDASEVVNPSTGTYEFRVFIVSADPIFNEPIGGTLILSENAAGSVTAWNALEGVPVTATRWPSFGEVTGKPTSYTPSAHDHGKLSVQDQRTMSGSDGTGHYFPAPNELDEKSLATHFGYFPNTGSNWKGSLTVKGWNDNYSAWQLIGGASTGVDNMLYFRTGRGTSWGTAYAVYHEGHRPAWAEVEGKPTQFTPTFNPNLGSYIGLGNDAKVIEYDDTNGSAGAGWSGKDAINFYGDGSIANSVVCAGHFQSLGASEFKGQTTIGGKALLNGGVTVQAGSWDKQGFMLEGAAPSIYFNQTDGDSLFAGVNSGTFYLLRDADGDGVFSSPYSFQVNLNGSGIYYNANAIYHEGNKPSFSEVTGVISASQLPSRLSDFSDGVMQGGMSFDGKVYLSDAALINWQDPSGSGGSAALSIAGDSTWLRYRFGGTSTLDGIEISDYDTTGIKLNRRGWAFFKGNVEVGGSLKSNGFEVLNGVDSWIRTQSNTGWYNATYGGGIYMSDSSWVRIYNSKKLLVSSGAYDSIKTYGGVASDSLDCGFIKVNDDYGFEIDGSRSGGWARGLVATNGASAVYGGAGFLGGQNYVTRFAVGFNDNTWWDNYQFSVSASSMDVTVPSNLSTTIITGNGTIAGTSFDSGWLRVGSSTNGWAIDPNEIYCSGTGIIGTLNGDLQLRPKGSVDLNGVKLDAARSGILGIKNSYGSLDIGANNTGYAHFYTDRPYYYMNTSLQVDGMIRVYGTQTHLSEDGVNLYLGATSSQYMRFDHNGGIHKRNTTWDANTGERTIFSQSWTDNIGDYIQLHATGNRSDNGALVISRDVFSVGRGNYGVPSGTTLAPFAVDNWMTVGSSIFALSGKEVFNHADGWLRINQSKDFSSGIYCGGSNFRTDGALQVGNGGASFNATTGQIDLKTTTRVHSYMHLKEIRSQDGNFTTIGAGELGNYLYAHATETYGTGNEGVHIGGEAGVYAYSHGNNMTGGMSAAYSVRLLDNYGTTHLNFLDVYNDQNNSNQVVARFRHPIHNPSIAIVAKNNDAGSFRIEANMDGQDLRIQTADTSGNYFTSGVSVGTIASFNRNGNVTITGELSTADTKARSDKRVKRKLRTISHALDKVNTLTGYTYDEINLKKRMASIIAQDVQKILPEAVGKDTDGMLNVSPMALIGLLVNAVKELSGQVRELQHGNV